MNNNILLLFKIIILFTSSQESYSPIAIKWNPHANVCATIKIRNISLINWNWW